jgi:hypothetical protein
MIKEWISRFSCPTPVFFKKVAKLGGVLLAGGGAIVAPTVVNVAMPHNLVSIASNLMVAGSVMIAVAKATKDDTVV